MFNVANESIYLIEDGSFSIHTTMQNTNDLNFIWSLNSIENNVLLEF
jgi:hypothetical protein